MGTRNTRASQSPLHSEVKALIWAIKCMKNLRQFNVTFATDYSQLMKDGFRIKRVAGICKLFGRHQDTERKFSHLIDDSYTTDA